MAMWWASSRGLAPLFPSPPCQETSSIFELRAQSPVWGRDQMMKPLLPQGGWAGIVGLDGSSEVLPKFFSDWIV